MGDGDLSGAVCGGTLGAFFISLLVTFVTLKLAGIVEWSWWIILSPLWAPCGCLCCGGGAVFIILLAASGKHHPADHP